MAQFGQNRGYIEELYASYLADPSSVSEAWRDYFSDFPLEPASSRPTALRGAPATEPAGAEPLSGIAARIAENMEESLGVPTATTVRTLAVQPLEENRRILNRHQEGVSGPKISYTHLVGWALLRALEAHPELRVAFAEIDGRPHRVKLTELRLGIAVDLERRGERVLLVPNIKHALELDFPAFVLAFDDLLSRARRDQLTLEDFEGTSVTLTNPGMLGTTLSVPRLMAGQGLIVGVGSIGYPPEYAGSSPSVIASFGVSKVMTVTSTYDHRVIQGAASGAFLATLDRLLAGREGLYERIFDELGVPREPVAALAESETVAAAGAADDEAITKQAGVLQLIRAFRVRGHLRADLDPLGSTVARPSELELSHYGLGLRDLDRQFVVGGLGGVRGKLTLREILDRLNETYCGHVGIEYMHVQKPEPRHWLQEQLERPGELPGREQRLRILKKLNAAEAFENFLGKSYVGQKRFSLEGAETLIPMLDALLADCASAEVAEVVIGMAHRGRLNVLANIVGKTYEQIFREFEGDLDPTTTHGSGDVKYHLGATGEYVAEDGRRLSVEVASNPSHLEAVSPVVEGLVRARQDRLGDATRRRVLPLLIHGDAAFAGQGVVAETLHLSELRGYRTGGTLHIVVNNQIGFTTGPADARSSHYATDVAKMVRAPIFHVNGDHPEEAVRVVRLALAFLRRFQRDVVIDLVCYRRWGHNELDDPSFTHPLLYAKIERQRSVRKLYTDRLLKSGDFDPRTAEEALEHYRAELQHVQEEVRRAKTGRKPVAAAAVEAAGETAAPSPATAVAAGTLARVLEGLERTPPGFEVHPKLARQLAHRRTEFEAGRIDWALAEAFAWGTLVLEGTPVRLSGEDSARGTFSQRHSILYDHRTGAPHVPLAELAPGQAPFQVFDSPLSEFAVLGFEYGYSVGHPETLVLWEAQFGDFANGAQVVLDQFVASAEEKWNQASGVTLLLPHGYEGQGPEHSSARLERFLELAARGNLRITEPSTPAQYFHLLRAQARGRPLKPLVVLTPKSLLRHRRCVSSAAELEGAAFRHVLDDERGPEAQGVARVLLTSGKIYYDLRERLDGTSVDDVVLARLEQLYPFPAAELAALLARYPAASEVAWVQEEPRNMGAWSFLEPRLAPLVGRRALRGVTRPANASPSTGSLRRHQAEQEALLGEALSPRPVATGR